MSAIGEFWMFLIWPFTALQGTSMVMKFLAVAAIVAIAVCLVGSLFCLSMTRFIDWKSKRDAEEAERSEEHEKYLELLEELDIDSRDL